MTRTVLHFPRTKTPAQHLVDAKPTSEGSGSKRGLTKGAARVWALVVLLALWVIIVGGVVYALLEGAAR